MPLLSSSGCPSPIIRRPSPLRLWKLPGCFNLRKKLPNIFTVWKEFPSSSPLWKLPSSYPHMIPPGSATFLLLQATLRVFPLRLGRRLCAQCPLPPPASSCSNCSSGSPTRHLLWCHRSLPASSNDNSSSSLGRRRCHSPATLPVSLISSSSHHSCRRPSRKRCRPPQQVSSVFCYHARRQRRRRQESSRQQQGGQAFGPLQQQQQQVGRCCGRSASRSSPRRQQGGRIFRL